jgi:hypothetical protein
VVDDSFGFLFTIQGKPQNYPSKLPPWGKLLAENSGGNIGNSKWGPILTSAGDPALCSQIGQIETAELYYSNNEVDYYPWGPNSNSLVSWLLESGNVDQYFTGPPGSLGWNTPLYGTLLGIPSTRRIYRPY